jgi:hypothetical protein
LLKVTSLLAVVLLAASPSVANLDATARASGSAHAIAVNVGERLFTTTWPVQVLQVIANNVDSHVVVGMRLSGVKFHEPTEQPQFDVEVSGLVQRAFATDPAIEEVDVWATVPVSVGKGLVVSGDLAMPTTRTVFAISVRRGESPDALASRLRRGTAVFLEPEWAATAFTKK